MTGPSLCAEEFQSDSLSSAVTSSIDEDREEHLNTDKNTAEQSAQRCETIKEEQQVLGSPTCTEEEEELVREQQTVQLVKEVCLELQLHNDKSKKTATNKQKCDKLSRICKNKTTKNRI